MRSGGQHASSTYASHKNEHALSDSKVAKVAANTSIPKLLLTQVETRTSNGIRSSLDIVGEFVRGKKEKN